MEVFRKTRIISGDISATINSESGVRTISLPHNVIEGIAKHAGIRLTEEWKIDKNSLSTMNPSLRGAVACRGAVV